MGSNKRNARKSVWFLGILLIFLLYFGVVVYSHHYRSAIDAQQLFPEDAAEILRKYDQEIQIIEDYAGQEITELNAETTDLILETSQELTLRQPNMADRFNPLINQIADASLEYKTYHMNGNPWHKPW